MLQSVGGHEHRADLGKSQMAYDVENLKIGAESFVVG